MKIRHIITITLALLLLAACGANSPNGDEADLPQIPVVEIETQDNYEDPDEEVYTPVISPAIPDYTIHLEICPTERTVSGVAAISFQNTSSYALDKVFLSMPFNAFSENHPYPPFLPTFEDRVFRHGHEFGSIDIALATINLNPAEFTLEGTLLTIYLEEYLPPAASLEIGLIFEAQIPRISHRTGGNDYAMWFGNFLPALPVLSAAGWHIYPYYPIGSPFFTATSNYRVNITAPTEYTVVSTGFGVRSEGETNTVTSVTADQVRDFAFAVLSPAYSARRITTETGIDITIHFRGNWDYEEAVNAILDTARAAFDYFESHVGAYPAQNFNIIETELFIHDAIKYPGLMFVDTLHMRTHAVHASVRRDIGHQWFYNVVGNNPVTEPWLAYGLVSFLQLEMTLEEDELAAHMLDVHQNLQNTIAHMAYPELSRSLGYYASWADFHSIQFLRGKLLFYDLWRLLGEEEFGTFIRTYYGRYAFSIATARGLIAVAEEIYGESLTDFFDDWITSPTLPDFGPLAWRSVISAG